MRTTNEQTQPADEGPVERTVRRQYVIRYADGAYNYDNGFPCRKFEATRYASEREAWDKADDLCDVAAVEEVDA
jgi:hypothetical protein